MVVVVGAGTGRVVVVVVGGGEVVVVGSGRVVVIVVVEVVNAGAGAIPPKGSFDSANFVKFSNCARPIPRSVIVTTMLPDRITTS